MFIAGSPKSNKSYLLINLMLDLARGRSLFGAVYPSGKPVFPVSKPWRVLYLEMEMGEQGLLERLIGKEGHPGIMQDIDPTGLELYIQPRDTAMRLDTDQGRDYIDNIIKTVKPDVTCLDPFAKFNLSDENAAMEMGAIMRTVDHIIEDYNTSVIFIHHIGKQSEENPRRGGDRMRGSSALFGDLDTLIEVTRKSSEHHPEPVIELSFELRRGEPIAPVFIQRKRDGTIEWMGDGYSFGSGESQSRNYPRGRYRNL